MGLGLRATAGDGQIGKDRSEKGGQGGMGKTGCDHGWFVSIWECIQCACTLHACGMVWKDKGSQHDKESRTMQ